jgi:hypothetical protein
MKKEHSVYEDNLTFSERKIVQQAFKKIQKGSAHFPFVSFTSEEFIEIAEIPGENPKSKIVLNLDRLSRKHLGITFESDFVYCPIFLAIVYEHGEVQLEFNSKIEMFLMDLLK